MQRDILLKTIKDYENEFKKFTGTGEFPTYELQTYETRLQLQIHEDMMLRHVHFMSHKTGNMFFVLVQTLFCRSI